MPEVFSFSKSLNNVSKNIVKFTPKHLKTVGGYSIVIFKNVPRSRYDQMKLQTWCLPSVVRSVETCKINPSCLRCTLEFVQNYISACVGGQNMERMGQSLDSKWLTAENVTQVFWPNHVQSLQPVYLFVKNPWHSLSVTSSPGESQDGCENDEDRSWCQSNTQMLDRETPAEVDNLRLCLVQFSPVYVKCSLKSTL